MMWKTGLVKKIPVFYIEWIRSLVGHRKILLAFASVVVRDHRGRVLLQRRTDFEVWGLPSGVTERTADFVPTHTSHIFYGEDASG